MKGTKIFEDPVQNLGEYTPEQYLKGLTLQGQEEAFFVFNVGDIIHKVKNWRLKMPRVKMYYAVKCNDSQPVLEVLATMGTGFDCASKKEIEQVMKLGVDPSRIIYAHPCKPNAHLRAAQRHGVDLMTFDNESELFKIQKLMPHAKLVLRIRCDALKAQCDLGSKFGAMPENAKTLLEKAHQLSLNVVGVSFHVGSGCQEPQVFTRAIKICREIFDQATEVGFSPYLLDIGGGFPGNSGSSLDACAHYINEAIDLHFPEGCGVEIIAEPGRYVAASAFLSATQIVSKREVKDDEGNLSSIMYYVNDGVYGSFNCLLYDHQVVHPQPVKEYDSPSVSCSIWGPTCDGLDILIKDMTMPQMEVGDWIMWKDMGAYTLSAAGTFNGFPVPKFHTVIRQHNWLFLESIAKDGSDFQMDWCQIKHNRQEETATNRTVSCAEEGCDTTDCGNTPCPVFSPAN